MSQAGRLFRTAQLDSRAGRHEAAVAGFTALRAAAPRLAHAALQEALALARADRLEAAAARLADEPAGLVRDLFAGYLAARAGRADEAVALLGPVVAAQPQNRVAATALGFALFRAGRPAEAVAAVGDLPGDNFEILSWLWLETERWSQGQPLAAEPAPPAPARATDVAVAVARRWLRAGEAAAMGNTNCVLRRRWLTAARGARPNPLLRALRPLLEALDRRWPSDPLEAILAVAATGHKLPQVALHLGAQLFDDGYPAAALPWLAQAAAELAESPEGYIPGMYRAAALVELRRWPEAAAALAEVARLADAEQADAGATHEFAQPHWFAARARVRLAKDDSAGAREDLLRALELEPTLFDERWQKIRPLLDALGSEGNRS